MSDTETLTDLKAKAFDLLTQQQAIALELQKVTQQIAKQQKETPDEPSDS